MGWFDMAGQLRLLCKMDQYPRLGIFIEVIDGDNKKNSMIGWRTQNVRV